VRWFTDLHPHDLHRYERAVAPLVSPIEGRLGPDVFANRAAGPGAGLLPMRPARQAWDRTLARLVVTRPEHSAVIADVRRCYASIRPAAVDRALGPDAHPVGQFLRRLEAVGIRGLPIGPEPSAIVANAVLAVADAAARSAGGRVLRWVDDVVLIGRDPASAARIYDAWVDALADLGLEPNDAKHRSVPRMGEWPFGVAPPSGGGAVP
jgi:hypothetical protein